MTNSVILRRKLSLHTTDYWHPLVWLLTVNWVFYVCLDMRALARSLLLYQYHTCVMETLALGLVMRIFIVCYYFLIFYFINKIFQHAPNNASKSYEPSHIVRN